MGAAWFFLSFLAVGILGADALTGRFETLPSDRIGGIRVLILALFWHLRHLYVLLFTKLPQARSKH
jgi:hypothetical protein